jgi:hypothetical protein
MTIESLKSCRTDKGFLQVWVLAEVMGTRIKTWIEDFPRISYREATAPRLRKVSKRLLVLTGEAEEAKPLPITAQDHHRVNTYFRSLDQVVAELDSRFTGNDQDVLCALGDVVLGNQPAQQSFLSTGSKSLQAERRSSGCGEGDVPKISK